MDNSFVVSSIHSTSLAARGAGSIVSLATLFSDFAALRLFSGLAAC